MEKKKIVQNVILVTSLASLGCGPTIFDGDPTLLQGPAQVSEISVMTFNIAHAAAGSLEEIAAVINAESPDFVGLQEVEVGVERSGFLDQASELGRLTGMEANFAATMLYDEGGQFGVALLARHHVAWEEIYPLHSTTQQRLLHICHFEQPTNLQVAVSHMAYTPEERVVQAGEIVGHLGGRQGTVLLADTNARPWEEPTQVLTSAMRDTWAESGPDSGYTYSAKKPSRRIDYIFLSPDLGPTLSVSVPDVRVSDHRPVVARVSLTP